MIGGHGLQRLRAEAGDAFTRGGTQGLGEVTGQRHDIFGALSQCRQRNREDIEAVIQVFAKLFIGHRIEQVLVGGGNHPHVHLALARVAHRFDHPLLQRSQNLGLQRQRHVAHFIEKQRALVGLLETSDPVSHGAGKGALAMTEHLAFQQALGNGGAVDRHERFVGAAAVLVDGTGDHFLAGAAFTSQQHGGSAVAH